MELRIASLLVGVGVLDGILYAVGGHDGPLVRKSVESYNPETKTWNPVADMAMCRRNAGVYAILAIIIIKCMSMICVGFLVFRKAKERGSVDGGDYGT
jgi:hypothetical protein